MTNEEYSRVYKVRIVVEEGTLDAENGFQPIIPGHAIHNGVLLEQFAAKNPEFRDKTIALAMDAIWKKLGLNRSSQSDGMCKCGHPAEDFHEFKTGRCGSSGCDCKEFR